MKRIVFLFIGMLFCNYALRSEDIPTIRVSRFGSSSDLTIADIQRVIFNDNEIRVRMRNQNVFIYNMDEIDEITFIGIPTTAILSLFNDNGENKCIKYIENGQVLIDRNRVTYDIHGNKIKINNSDY